LTKPAKVFGLDDSRIWKAEKINNNTYAIADLGENENQEPPDTVSIKLPREIARQVGRYKSDGETLKSATERLILEAIAARISSEKINESNGDLNKLPILMPIYIPSATIKKINDIGFWNPDQTYQDMVLEWLEAKIKELEF
jgi:hypothetical protein